MPLFRHSGVLWSVDCSPEGRASALARPLRGAVLPLTEISAKLIVSDVTMTKQAVECLPQELIPILTRIAINKDYLCALNVLLCAWPSQVLRLRSIWPEVQPTVLSMQDADYNVVASRKCMQLIQLLVNSFLEYARKCSLEQSPYNGKNKLRILDLNGYPAIDHVIQFLWSKMLLLVGLNKLKKTKQGLSSNSAVPESNFQPYTIVLDTVISEDLVLDNLFKAIVASSSQYAVVKLIVNQLKISDIGIQPINRILLHLHKNQQHPVSGLSVAYNSLGTDGCTSLLHNVQPFSGITSLDISCNNINPAYDTPSLEAICAAFGQMRRLTRLDLSNSRSTGSVERMLSPITSGLKYLRLCGCVLNVSDITYLQASHHAEHIQELDLSENAVIGKRHDCTSQLLSRLRALQILEMENCAIIDLESFIVITAALSKLTLLRYINLSKNCASRTETLELCAPSWGLLRNLECLKLSCSEDCLDVNVDGVTTLNEGRWEALRRGLKAGFGTFRGEVDVVFRNKVVVVNFK